MPPALEPQYAPVAPRGLCGTAFHQPAAAGSIAVGSEAGVVAGRGGGHLAACRRRMGYRELRAARPADGAPLLPGSPTGSAELRHVAGRLLRQYDFVAREEVLPAGGRKVRTQGKLKHAHARLRAHLSLLVRVLN